MRRRIALLSTVCLALVLLFALGAQTALAETGIIEQTAVNAAYNPVKPASTVKLIFIHHSTGQNWLADYSGGLGKTLGQNSYFVSDTNYGWGPDAIGDRTDIPNWIEWFRSGHTATYMDALFDESGQNSSYTRTLPDPGGENEIIMFKSCFPNSALGGGPTDSARMGSDLTVANAKYAYNELLRYFATRQDKLFVVITAPPLMDATYAANARAFNEWLVNDWLRENAYPYVNVAVFDFYNVLTGPNNHHRYINGAIQHVYTAGMNTNYYPSSSGDDHPNDAGNVKARNEFIPLLNVFYNRWKAGPPSLTKMTVTIPSTGTSDGYIVESSESSGVGGALGAGTVIVGDNSQRRQYRSILSFNTAVLPDNAWITSVALKVKRRTQAGDPFATLGSLYVDIRKPFFGTASTLAAADFQSGSSRNTVGTFGVTATNAWYTATLTSFARQWVSRTSITQFRLRFKIDDDNDASSDYLRFYSGTAIAAAERPVLVIQYYRPS